MQDVRVTAEMLGSALGHSSAEESSPEQSTRLSEMIESAMDAVLVLDSQERIIFFDAGAERIFAYPAKEAYMQRIERFIPSWRRKRVGAHLADLPDTGSPDPRVNAFQSLRAVRANGEEFPVEVSISHVETGGVKLFTVIVHATSARERAEVALRTSEQQKASILNSLSTHVVVVDAKGTVVAENDPAIAFPTRDHPLRSGVGSNYFESCNREIGKGGPEFRAAFAAIRTVFEGKGEFAEVSFPVVTPTEERWLCLSVTPLQGADGGIVLSYQDITERRRSEDAIRDLSGRVIHAQEEERSRIARELHDDVNQQLAMLCIDLQQILPSLPASLAEPRQKIEEIWKKAHALSAEVQGLSHQLHSAKLQHLGLVPALRDLCREFTSQYKIPATFHCGHVPVGLAGDISLSLFRAAQESLRNIAKHSGAHDVHVHLVGGETSVVLRVTDDGVGFDVPARRGTGLGLISLNERMRLVGGSFSVSSKPSLGTQVEATAPMARHPAPAR